MKCIRAADLFCGAGGSSTGLLQACEEMGVRCELLAVNHWPTAVETHAANHPQATHLCASLDGIDPLRFVPGGKLDILLASPECTHHSVARGGKPMSDQSRASAWHVIRWAESLQPRTIIVENVREFATWGPLGSNGRPLKRQRGATFHAWLDALRSIGYRASYRIVNAADYGAATTRQRLFILASKGRSGPHWPEPTHTENPAADLFARRQKWRAAKEVIDWSLPGKSIFGRERPLQPKTMQRIMAGLKKFCGLPFVMNTTHMGGDRVYDVANPLPTVTGANRGELSLVQPFLVPFFGERETQDPRCHDIEQPLPTVTGHGAGAVVQPFVVTLRGTSGDIASLARGVGAPLATITAGGTHHGLCEPFLVQYHGKGSVYPVSEPLRTIDTNDRYALVTVNGTTALLQVLFRMLQPGELAAAMSFPSGYIFKGTRSDQVKQIGNAVDVRQARALCRAQLAA